MTSGSLVKTVDLECMNSGVGRSLDILLLFYFTFFLFPFDSKFFFFAETTFPYSDTYKHKNTHKVSSCY